MQNIKEISKELKSSLQKKEEIQKLLSNLESLRGSGGMTAQRYDFLKSDYRRQMEAAVSKLSSIKSYISNAIQTPKQNLNSSKTELETLRAEYNNGSVSLNQLHRQEEKINQRIRNYRAEIADLQFLLDTKSSVQLSTEYTTLDSSLIRRGWPAWATALVIIFPIFIVGILLGTWIPTAMVNNNTSSTNVIAATSENTTKPSIDDEGWITVTKKTKPCVVFIINRSNNEYTSFGSGVIIDGRGYILTNNHVIFNSNTGRIEEESYVYLFKGNEIRLDDNRYRANVVDRNEAKDIALLKISADITLSAVNLGDSDSIHGEEEIRAIGYPVLYYDQSSKSFGYPTVKPGIISEPPRLFTASSKSKLTLRNCYTMRTTAPVNHGNSGGALINNKGELIGIPTFILGEDVIESFAVAINEAKPMIQKALSK